VRALRARNSSDAISVPAAKAQEFNEKMVRLHRSKDAAILSVKKGK